MQLYIYIVFVLIFNIFYKHMKSLFNSSSTSLESIQRSRRRCGGRSTASSLGTGGEIFSLGLSWNLFSLCRNLTEEAEIEDWIGKGQYIVKELEALYSLRKYRAMKARYYDDQ